MEVLDCQMVFNDDGGDSLEIFPGPQAQQISVSPQESIKFIMFVLKGVFEEHSIPFLNILHSQ